MCTDHPVVQEMVGLVRDRRVITYGRNPQADVRLTELEIIDGQVTSPSRSAIASA